MVKLVDQHNGTFSIITNGTLFGYVRANSEYEAAKELLKIQDDDVEMIDVLKRHYGNL